MSYRNKTYVIFDGDNDRWALAFMRGWKSSEHLTFNFHDAHEVGSELTDRASEQTIKRRLRERFSSAKQAAVLLGANTKNLFRFVRWEIDVALELDLPVIAIHLAECPKWYDAERIPPILRDEYVVHVPFKMRIIQYALDNFPTEYKARKATELGPRFYPSQTFEELGLDECK